jgi:hypothetical protein
LLRRSTKTKWFKKKRKHTTHTAFFTSSPSMKSLLLLFCFVGHLFSILIVHVACFANCAVHSTSIEVCPHPKASQNSDASISVIKSASR